MFFHFLLLYFSNTLFLEARYMLFFSEIVNAFTKILRYGAPPPSCSCSETAGKNNHLWACSADQRRQYSIIIDFFLECISSVPKKNTKETFQSNKAFMASQSLPSARASFHNDLSAAEAQLAAPTFGGAVFIT